MQNNLIQISEKGVTTVHKIHVEIKISIAVPLLKQYLWFLKLVLKSKNFLLHSLEFTKFEEILLRVFYVCELQLQIQGPFKMRDI